MKGNLTTATIARERLRPRLARALPFIEEIKSQFGNGKKYRMRHDLVVKEDEAKASSKDPGSAAIAAIWIGPTEAATCRNSRLLTRLKKGHMTDTPVKSPFGWHVILLVDFLRSKRSQAATAADAGG